MKKWFNVKKIGQLDEEIVLVYGDEPVLFVCKDNNGQRYLCMSYDSSMLNYVIAPISDDDLISMLENRISMDLAFRRNGIIYYTEDDEISESDDLAVTVYKADQFPEDHLPDAGENYDLKFEWVDKYIQFLKEERLKTHSMIMMYQPFKEGLDLIRSISYRNQRQAVNYVSPSENVRNISANYRKIENMQIVNNACKFDERAA